MIERYSHPGDGGGLGRHDPLRRAGWRSSCWPPRPTPSSASCPADDAAACRERAPVVDDAFVAAVAERERTTDHDVAAFVDVVQARIGAPAGSWIHYGLTSSDVVDTALCWAMRDAADLVLDVDRRAADDAGRARPDAPATP